jgi:ACT domain-containing protein
MQKTVITVIGHDMVGIVAKVTTLCAEKNANVIEVTQSVLQDLFAMIIVADISGLKCPFTQFAAQLADLGVELGLDIRAMHEDIFNSMHRV